jgi:hypothetical protein
VFTFSDFFSAPVGFRAKKPWNQWRCPYNLQFIFLFLFLPVGVLPKNYIKSNYYIEKYRSFSFCSLLSKLIRLLFMKINDTLLKFRCALRPLFCWHLSSVWQHAVPRCWWLSLASDNMQCLAVDDCLASDNMQCLAVGDCLPSDNMQCLSVDDCL